jgi:xanthine dehydrogenase accessory factor
MLLGFWRTVGSLSKAAGRERRGDLPPARSRRARVAPVVSVEEELAARVASGEETVLATVVRAGGNPPSRPGAKLLLSRTRPLAGTLGCSEFDAAALAEAAPALDAGTPRMAHYEHELGEVDVYLEPYAERPTLVVGSATPVAHAVLHGAAGVGFRTVLVETRSGRLGEGRWEADSAVARLEDLDAQLPASGALYAVLTDHDSPDVVPLCAALLPRRPRFLGLMGSRRHTSPHLEALRAHGAGEEELAAIRTPVGLDLGGRTASEIAVAIVAGLVAARRGGSGGWLDEHRSPGHESQPPDAG